ncbi:hypothetical protein AAIH70_29915 [Neorhizobium sp. BT27B]|uniref:NmrA family NAD(P)-binding protein n=1 Tax=Neorhizobium sp. BT27B TaxID=3142625 RepID=UPI003D26F0D2
MIAATGIPAAINRGAYYFTNLDAMLGAARSGVLLTPFPPDLRIPMVSPNDLAKAAATRLSSSVEDIGVRYIEGPERYMFADVVAAFSRMLGKSVEIAQIPREEIEQSFRALGFSEPAAEAYTRMTLSTIEDPDLPDDPDRGSITLEQYLATLAAAR